MCCGKARHENDLDWQEIIDILGANVSVDHFRKVASGIIEYDEYLHDTNGAATRILALSDFHIPFNLPLDTFKEYAGRTDVLVLNGDIQDCMSISSFPKLYRSDFTKEMVLTRTYMIDLINMIKPKKVVITKGNHEARLSKYLSKVVTDDVLRLMPDSPMDLIVNRGFYDKDRLHKTETYYSSMTDVFKDSGIAIIYNGTWHEKIGKTIFCHPLAYSAGMLKTTEKAVNFFLREDRDFDTIVMAHTHKLGSFTQGGVHMYEQGCCCDISKLDYADGKLTLPAQNGFLYLCQDKDGAIMPNKTKLIDL